MRLIFELSTSWMPPLLGGMYHTLVGPLSSVGLLLGGCYMTLAFVAGGQWWRSSTVRAHQPRGRQAAHTWLVLSLALLGLALHSAFGLLDGITQHVRGRAFAHEWYGNRSTLQMLFILVVLGIATSAVPWIARTVRSLGDRRLVVLVLVTLLAVCFTTIRAISLHHVDLILRLPIGPIPLHRGLELALLAVLGALLFHMYTRPQRWLHEQATSHPSEARKSALSPSGT